MAKTTAESKIDTKHQALEGAVEQIREKFGDGSIMKLKDARAMDVESTPTGSISLDLALGVGGIPKGRVIEVFGPESSGKTTLAMHMVAEVQKRGGTAAFVDAEHALDPDYAERIGVKLDDLLISQPDTGEQALDIVDTLVRSNAVDIIVVDSVAALTQRAEIEGEMGDSHMGLHARLMSQALRKLTGIMSKSKTTVIFINQIRMKIGVMFGNPETTTGGQALKFYCSVRLEVRKVAAPFRIAEFDLMWNEGISYSGDLLDTAVLYSVVNKNGNSYSYQGEKMGVGRENAKQFIKDNPKVAAAIDAAVRKAAGEKTANENAEL